MGSRSDSKVLTWRVKLSLGLLLAAAAVYAVHFLIFRDIHHIAIYLIGDIAFLFISVLAVTLVFETLLRRREKAILMRKMNMVIGTFFSDVGYELLVRFSLFVENAAELAPRLAFTPRWERKDFLAAMQAARTFQIRVRVTPESLSDLRDLLREHRPFLLRLLENPNLLEHDRFTDLLWAVFHVIDELEMRRAGLAALPASDLAHLANDVKRAYSLLTAEWTAYALHLKESYPFLFSLTVRVNPFAPDPSPIVQD
jgi:hypothetical protein